MNSIIRVLMREIVGKAVLFGYRSEGQLLLLLGSKEAVHLTKICPSVNF